MKSHICPSWRQIKLLPEPSRPFTTAKASAWPWTIAFTASSTADEGGYPWQTGWDGNRERGWRANCRRAGADGVSAVPRTKRSKQTGHSLRDCHPLRRCGRGAWRRGWLGRIAFADARGNPAETAPLAIRLAKQRASQPRRLVAKPRAVWRPQREQAGGGVLCGCVGVVCSGAASRRDADAVRSAFEDRHLVCWRARPHQSKAERDAQNTQEDQETRRGPLPTDE